MDKLITDISFIDTMLVNMFKKLCNNRLKSLKFLHLNTKLYGTSKKKVGNEEIFFQILIEKFKKINLNLLSKRSVLTLNGESWSVKIKENIFRA